MEPIRFTCEAELCRKSRAEVFEGFLELESWDSFTGYGFLPGIKRAVFDVKIDQVAGSIIGVENTDGSKHKEKILTWIPHELIEVKFMELPSPLSVLATHFVERWEFFNREGSERVRRIFFLYPRNWITRPFLQVIAIFLEKAISGHLQVIARD